MAVQFVADYLVAFAGLAVGAVAGFLIARGAGRAPSSDRQLTMPLVLAAGTAHLALIPVVEMQRQVLFGLYFLAMAAVFGAGVVGRGPWRAGAILFPAGSIAGYLYFALIAHQADVVGLVVKAVEIAVITTAVIGIAMRRESMGERKRSVA
jgi:hypothetical protein